MDKISKKKIAELRRQIDKLEREQVASEPANKLVANLVQAVEASALEGEVGVSEKIAAKMSRRARACEVALLRYIATLEYDRTGAF